MTDLLGTRPVELDEELIRLGDGGPPSPGAGVLAHTRLEAVARDDPDRVAVVTRGETLTYGELNARANRVARRLRAAGVEREDVVGICLPRRLDVLVTVYGVMKSGGAYLPLDLVQPLERRRFMLEDAGASCLVTAPGWRDELADGLPLAVICPEDWAHESGAAADVAPASPGDLAYVIYTSGSTGRPKGVEIEHRSLAAYVDWGLSTFTEDELRCVLMATAFGFDMSVFEYTIPLAAGGRIVLVDNLFELPDVADEGLTLVNAVPSLMAALLARGVDLPASVRTAVFCGETLPFEVSEAVHRQRGVTRVVNTYGPTEDTVYSTYVDVPAGERPTIGQPFPGTQAYVVDDDLELVPHGEAGELCLGGIGLARGYRGREDLTNKRFVGNPFGEGRIYRTGDLARWEADGTLQHLGRIDHQIKLHGVRIEPGDIEEALLCHPDIVQAVVVARDRPAGGRWLVAYVVCADGCDPQGRDLRAQLQELLPRTMIPSAFVKLEAMPLNANGKLDRARLPEPLTVTAAAGSLTPTEQVVAGIWRELLPLEHPPGPDDDYFALGGDSLTAFEVFARIEAELGPNLSPTLLLEASTLGSLAAMIDSGAERGRLVHLHPDGGRIPVTYIQSGAGGVLSLRTMSAVMGPDQPLIGIQAFVDEDVEAGNIQGVVPTADDCLDALREAQPHGPYILAGHSIGGHIAFEVATRLEAAGESVLLVALLDPPAPHTLRRRGRMVARVLDVTGWGAEPRRRGAARALLTAAAGAAGLGRRSEDDAVYDGNWETGGALSAWMQHLFAIEREFRPRRYRGRVAVYTTADGTRFTGSRTLGWQRYVGEPIAVRRVPGDHVSMLLEPHVEVLAETVDADVREAQQRAPARAA